MGVKTIGQKNLSEAAFCFVDFQNTRSRGKWRRATEWRILPES